MEPEGSSPHLQLPVTYPYPEPEQSSPCPLSHILKIHLNIILPFAPRSPKWPLSSRFHHQNPVYTSPLSSIRATCPTHFILLDLITGTILGEEYRSLSSSLCSCLHTPVTVYLLGPNILLSTLFSDTLSLRSFFSVSDRVSLPCSLDAKTDRNSVTDRKRNYTLCVEAFIRKPVFLNPFEPRLRLGQRLSLATPGVRNKDCRKIKQEWHCTCNVTF